MATYEETVQSILDRAAESAVAASAEDLVLLAKAAQAVDISSGIVVSGLAIIQGAKDGSISDIDLVKTNAIAEVQSTATTGLTAVDLAKTNAIAEVQSTATTGLTAVDLAKTNAIAEVQSTATTVLTENVKTINGESLVGVGDIVIESNFEFPSKLAEGHINLSNYFTTQNINWSATNTSNYGHLIQRTDNVASGVAQFALIQGGAKGAGDATSMGTILPFQVNNDNTIAVGTPTVMFTSSSVSDFSTYSVLTDNKSGAFHYSGNIPWTGCTTHTMGWGRGRLMANNTAGEFWNSGTSTTDGIHDHNGMFFGVPDSDGSGFRGVNAGHTSADSRTRIHFCDFSNPSSPSVSVQNPSANTSTSPVMNLIRRAGSNSSNTAICGISHWRDANNYVNARVFAANANSSQDYNSSKDWGGEYSQSSFFGVELSNGKVLVYHGSKTYLYTAYNSRTDVTSLAGAAIPLPSTDVHFFPACIVPDGTDSWLMLNSTGASTIVIQKWTINPTTYKWTKNYETLPYTFTGQSYMKLNELPNNRLMISTRKSSGLFEYMIIDRPTGA